MCLTLRVIHTMIALWNIFCLFYMIYACIGDRKNILLRIAYFSIIFEVSVLAVFCFDCPLSLLQCYLYPHIPTDFFPDMITDNITIFGFCLLGIFFLIKCLKLFKKYKKITLNTVQL
jgi:hypothetical protein